MAMTNISSLLFRTSLLVLFLVFLTLMIFSQNVWADDIYIDDIDGNISPNGDGTFTLSNIVIWITNGTNTDRPILEIRLRCFVDNEPISGSEKLFTNIDPEILLKKSVDSGMQPFYLIGATWNFGSECTGIGVQVTHTKANSVKEEILTIDFSDYRSIENIKSLDFGAFSAANGSITVTPYGQYSLANIIYHNGGVQAAEFEVTGFENASFQIGLPVNATISYDNIDEMVVNNFTSSLTNNTGVIETGNSTKSFFVGADLIVNSGQVPGKYTGYFIVTADFY